MPAARLVAAASMSRSNAARATASSSATNVSVSELSGVRAPLDASSS